jgi:hypothetical protein
MLYRLEKKINVSLTGSDSPDASSKRQLCWLEK